MDQFGTGDKLFEAEMICMRLSSQDTVSSGASWAGKAPPPAEEAKSATGTEKEKEAGAKDQTGDTPGPGETEP